MIFWKFIYVFYFNFSNKKLKIEHQLIDEVEIKGDYDKNSFLSPACQETYYEDLSMKKLFLESGITLE